VISVTIRYCWTLATIYVITLWSFKIVQRPSRIPQIQWRNWHLWVWLIKVCFPMNICFKSAWQLWLLNI